MIDTHTHIQFKSFDKTRDDVIKRAKKAGVEKIIAVGTDLISSREAILVAEKYPEVFASAGIHPHHVFEFLKDAGIATSSSTPRNDVIAISRSEEAISGLEGLINHPKVLAIGETGMDKHIYTKTKYQNYLISDRLINFQKDFFQRQIHLAIKHNKSLIIHNREAVSETLEVLEKNWDKKLENRAVFHFCEPDIRLLDFAKSHNIFIGVDEDVLNDKRKQEFVKQLPLDLLVLETDSPFISPEPKNLLQILEYLSGLLNQDPRKFEEIVYKNSLELFSQVLDL